MSYVKKRRRDHSKKISSQVVTIGGVEVIDTEIGIKRQAGIHKRRILADKEGSVFTSEISGNAKESVVTRRSITARRDITSAIALLSAIFFPLREEKQSVHFFTFPKVYHSVLRVKKRFYPVAAIYGANTALSEETRESYARMVMDDIRKVLPESEFAAILTGLNSGVPYIGVDRVERTVTVVGRSSEGDVGLRTIRSLDTGLVLSTTELDDIDDYIKNNT